MPGADDKTADDKAGGDEAFLTRWARRKEAQRQVPPPADQVPEEAGAPGEAEAAGAAEPPLAPEDLPDIDSLDEGSDFTVFLKDGVPASLRRRALRKLWRLNPVFANLDGLAEYDEDYHTVLDLPGGVKTLFQAGKGMVQPEAEAKPEEPEGLEAAEEPAEPSADAPVAEAEADRLASLPEGPEEPLPTGREQDLQAAAAVDAAPVPVEPARPSPAARGSAVKRRWGGFES